MDASSIRWDLLVGTAAGAICAAFAYSYKRQYDEINLLTHAPAFNSTTQLAEYLVELAGENVTEIEYASVLGRVLPDDGVGLRSVNLPDTYGVVNNLQCVEHVSEYNRLTYHWSDVEKLISLNCNEVSFSLSDDISNVSVLSPNLSRALPLRIIYDKFEAQPESSFSSNLFNFVNGTKVKGYQHIEKILPVGTILTGVGKVKNTEGTISISPPEGSRSYILTTQSLSEIKDHLKAQASTTKYLMIGFGSVAVIAFGYMVWKAGKNFMNKRRIGRMLDEMGESRGSDLTRESCVVCLEHARAVVLIPCGHVCVCLVCVEMITLCPICRDPFERIVRTYHS